MSTFYDPQASGEAVLMAQNSEFLKAHPRAATTDRAANYEERSQCVPLGATGCPSGLIPVRTNMRGTASGLDCGTVLCARPSAGGFSLNLAAEGAYSLAPKCAGQQLAVSVGGKARAIGTIADAGAQTDSIHVESPEWFCLKTRDLYTRGGAPIGDAKPRAAPSSGAEGLCQDFSYNGADVGYMR